MHHLVNLPANFAGCEFPIVRINRHGQSFPRRHRYADHAVDARSWNHAEAKSLQHHRERNLQDLKSETRSDTNARAGAEWHVFVLIWLDALPALGSEAFRFWIQLGHMMGEVMAAKHASIFRYFDRSHCKIALGCANGEWHRRQNAHAFVDHVLEKRELRQLLPCRGRASKHAIEFIHELVHDSRMLREEKERPGKHAGARFEACAE